MEKNNQVCVSFSTGHKMYFQHEEVACSWGMLFKSVMAWGLVEYLEDIKDKEHCLNLFMKKYAGKEMGHFKYSMPSLKNVKVLKIDILKMTGKKRGINFQESSMNFLEIDKLLSFAPILQSAIFFILFISLYVANQERHFLFIAFYKLFLTLFFVMTFMFFTKFNKLLQYRFI